MFVVYLLLFQDLKEYLKVSALMEQHTGQQPLTRIKNIIDFFVMKNDYGKVLVSNFFVNLSLFARKILNE